MANEKNTIKKTNWASSFTLVGKPIISNFTFKIDEHSEKSSWVYNSMNLLVDCGEKHGRISCEMLGGYNPDGNSIIYAHGKDENGRDDFSNQIQVDWDDRFDEDVIDNIGDMSFITVGLEKTNEDKTFYKKFLSEYDAIAYVEKHLTKDMVIRVSGNLKYSTYNDKTQIRKNITSIVLSSIEDPSDFFASFRQSVLVDKESTSLKNIDKDKGVMYVDARVLDYVKEMHGVEIRGQYPFPYQFEYPMPFDNKELCGKIYDKLFRVKKGIRQITFDGEFVESGATTTVTWDDVPDNIKELVGIVYTKEEAIAECATNSSRERRMVIKKPFIRKVGDSDKQTPVLQIFDEQYTEDDLDMSWVFENEADDNLPFEEDEKKSAGSTGDDDDWLSMLD